MSTRVNMPAIRDGPVPRLVGYGQPSAGVGCSLPETASSVWLVPAACNRPYAHGLITVPAATDPK